MSYVLTREALKRLVKRTIIYGTCEVTDQVNEDFNVGDCLKNEALQINTLDEFKRYRFFPVPIGDFISAERRDPKYWLWSYNYYPVKWKLDCCSNTFIGEHNATIEYQYLLRYLIYNSIIFLNNKYNRVTELPKKKTFQEMLIESFDIEL
jgi:glycoprotein-N-acetylgalactosamine 3-beta-galactosyltransferase